jgi:glycosyltransferase involved in cell wall biosynthesis
VVDAVLDGVTGLTVPTENPSALAQALADLMTDPEHRHQLGITARRRAMTEFAREQVWAAHAIFLASLLADPLPTHTRPDHVRA